MQDILQVTLMTHYKAVLVKQKNQIQEFRLQDRSQFLSQRMNSPRAPAFGYLNNRFLNLETSHRNSFKTILFDTVI